MYHGANSPAIRKTILVQRFVGPVIFLAMPFLFRLLNPKPFWFFLTGYIIASLLWIIFYPSYFKRHIRTGITKMLKEGNNTGIVGPQTLTVGPVDIIETNESKEVKSKWSSVQKVVRTEINILIYTSSVGAIIIPIRSFDNERKADEFFQMAQNYQKGKKE
jgi:hypothetical protein